VRLTEQVADAPLPLSAQLALDGETPPPLAVKFTFPVGAVGVPNVSVTVAVQRLEPPTAIGVAQLSDVVVARLTSIEAFPELVACVPSPA
jgi:hypothetical protein